MPLILRLFKVHPLKLQQTLEYMAVQVIFDSIHLAGQSSVVQYLNILFSIWNIIQIIYSVVDFQTHESLY